MTSLPLANGLQSVSGSAFAAAEDLKWAPFAQGSGPRRHPFLSPHDRVLHAEVVVELQSKETRLSQIDWRRAGASNDGA